jgi:hypothetical protein
MKKINKIAKQIEKLFLVNLELVASDLVEVATVVVIVLVLVVDVWFSIDWIMSIANWVAFFSLSPITAKAYVALA